MSFRDFLDRLRGRRPGAADELVRRYGEALHDRADRLLPDARSSLVQETLIQTVRHAPEIRAETEAEFNAWLTATLVNERNQRLRRRSALKRAVERTRRLFSSGGRPREVADPATTPGSAAARAEEADAVRRAVDALPAELRDVVRLRTFELLTTRQAADRLGVAEATVRKREAEAHEILRGRLKGLS